jgi:hypothetical protein
VRAPRRTIVEISSGNIHIFLGKPQNTRWADPLLIPNSSVISRHERPSARKVPILAIHEPRAKENYSLFESPFRQLHIALKHEARQIASVGRAMRWTYLPEWRLVPPKTPSCFY